MSTILRRWVVASCAGALFFVSAGLAGAQPVGGQGNKAVRDLGPVEIQRLFDAYTAMQAQQALDLDDAQFGRFLPRLKALQDSRRRFDIERQRLVADLARLIGPGSVADEAKLRDQLKTLSDLDARGQADIRASADALEQTLDIRRLARFKVFEMQMERRKFELVLRARRGQAARVPRQEWP